LESLLHQIDARILVLTGIIVTASVLAGLVVGRLGRKKLVAEVGEAHRLRARAEAHAKDQSQALARMRREEGSLASLALSLPSVVRERNRSDTDSRRIPHLILNLAESIFRPGQMLFYLTCSTGTARHELRLLTQKGLTEIPEELQCVPFGKGKIGWVADHKLDMLYDDWINLTRTDGMTVEENHPLVRADIVGPLIQYDPQVGERVLGVLCIGSVGVRPRDEKLMFQMVTNLGSLALVNSHNVRRLRSQANHDGLTRLLNKRHFLAQLAPIIVDAEKEAQNLALFIFDIDHFKTYNDTNGHPAGDELLRGLAGLLIETMRPGDLCCRYGGEEFMVAMPQTDAATANAVAESIRRAIESHTFEHQEKQPNRNLTISGGVSVFPKDGPNIEALIQAADEALYESKRAGRNRVTRHRNVGLGDFERRTDVDLLPTPEDV
jgi:diguanylate cyclase (GGDEF)-like protein